MAEPVFTRTFLRQYAELEKDLSPSDRAVLERAIALIAMDPALPGRVPSFYDPVLPSYLYRSGPFLLRFREISNSSVGFLNLFYRRA